MELQGKRIAVLVADRYEDLELWYPVLRLREAGAEVVVVGTGAASYASKHGLPVQADASVEQVDAEDVDAIVIPSGPSAETFDAYPVISELVHAAMQHGKVVAAVVPAGQTIMATPHESDEQAHRLFSLQQDVVTDDGPFGDSAVIRQGSLIMARTPVDLLAFCRMIIEALAAPSTPAVGHAP